MRCGAVESEKRFQGGTGRTKSSLMGVWQRWSMHRTENPENPARLRGPPQSFSISLSNVNHIRCLTISRVKWVCGMKEPLTKITFPKAGKDDTYEDEVSGITMRQWRILVDASAREAGGGNPVEVRTLSVVLLYTKPTRRIAESIMMLARWRKPLICVQSNLEG